MALIQAALDTLDFAETVELAKSISPYVDIIELGTPCIKYNGIRIVEAVRAAIPDWVQVLADLKTMDAGLYEAKPFYAAGANIVTVLGAADKGTVAGVVEASRGFRGALTQVDLIGVDNKQHVAVRSADLGAHIIGVHTGLDQQAAGETPFKDLNQVAMVVKTNGLSVRVSVAGGINKNTIRQVIENGADIVVVGAAIYGAEDPAKAAAEIRAIVNAI
jgi:3-hexulose-6-phosphate synthase